MAFDPLVGPVPTTIKAVNVHLSSELRTDPETQDVTEVKSVSYSLIILDENGEHMGTKDGKLNPHLSQAQIDALIQFMDDMRAMAEAALPSP
jgi:hypothetical protein